MLLPLKMRFNTVHVAHGLRDEDARDLMNRSKLVLNIHNENYVNFENRVVQGLFCARPVLRERLSGNLLQPDRDYVLFTSPDELAARVADILNGRQWTLPSLKRRRTDLGVSARNSDRPTTCCVHSRPSGQRKRRLTR